MGPPDLERRFDRYRRKGDPADLAAVFDASASEILRIAAYLARDRAAAEDLLQRTFLTAIEAADTWDRSRRLLPWLLGILANHVKESSRRASRSPDPDRLAARNVEDPLDAASRQEAASAATQAIKELPDPTRSILVMRYRHGLEPAEIAIQLGMPPATVRSHLHRGIRLVRQKVPGVAAAVPLLRLDGAPRGLAEIRRVVVSRAAVVGAEISVGAAVGAGAGGLAAGGALVGRKSLPWAAGLLLFFGGVASLIFGRDRGPEEPRRDQALAALEVERHPPMLAPRAGAAGAQGTAAPGAGLAATVPSTGALEVRILASDGSVLPDVSFSFTPGNDPDPLLHRTGRTDAGGRGRLDGLGAGRGWVYWAHGWGDSVEIEAGGVARAELRLSRELTSHGLDFAGVVVDAEGTPVAGAEVWIDCLNTRWNTMMQVTRTNADGTFSVRDAHAPLSVSARAIGYASSPCRHLQVAERGKKATVRLVLGGPGASLRGRVEDVNGVAVPNALVLIGNPKAAVRFVPDVGSESDPLPILTYTADDGTFAAEGLPFGKTSIVVRARGRGVHREFRDLVAGQRPDDWVFRLPPAITIEGIVVDEMGVPVEGAFVGLSHDFGSSGYSAFMTDAQGRFRFDDQSSGREISLYAMHGKTGMTTLTGGGIDSPLDPIVRMVLHPWPQVRIRVVDERGAPIADRRVSAQSTLDTTIGPVSARTDADGRATLNVGAEGTYTLKVMDVPGNHEDQPIAGRSGVKPGADEVTLVVRERDRPTARVVGRLVVAEGPLPDGAQMWMNAYMRPFALSLDATSGRFESRPFQPGRYELVLATAGAWVPLARVRLAPGQTLDVGDIRLDPPGSLIVNLEGDDALVHSQGGVWAISDRGRVWARLSGDGTARFGSLRPGLYQLVVTTIPKGAVAAPTTVVIEPRRESSAEVRMTAGHVRHIAIRGLDPDDAPGTTIEVRTAVEDTVVFQVYLAEAVRDRDAEFRGTFAPGRYVATAETQDGRLASAAFEVRGEGEPPVILTGFK